MIVTSYPIRKFRGFRGFGDSPLVTTPSYAVCDPLDVACVAANAALASNYDIAMGVAQAGNNYTQCLANAANAVGTAQIQSSLAACNGQFITQAPAGTPVPSGSTTTGQQIVSPSSNNASFSFVSTGGNPQSLINNVDTWTVRISGAAPGTSVSVSATVGNTSLGQTVQGRTDGSGNFTVSGVASGPLGNWHEIWYVGGQQVGNIWFNLVAATTNVTPPSQAPAQSIVTPSTSGTVAPPVSSTVFDLFGDTSSPISIGSFQIGEYTALGLAAALVVGFMMLKGRRF